MTGFSPNRIPNKLRLPLQNTSIAVSGTGFVEDSMICYVNNVTFPARFINSTLIFCDVDDTAQPLAGQPYGYLPFSVAVFGMPAYVFRGQLGALVWRSAAFLTLLAQGSITVWAATPAATRRSRIASTRLTSRCAAPARAT